ncbi:hypothetical protein HD553DRAFT_78179 [Filobasidium floriforme]|uniref:uncharacterized protein n=1 Tax=Filobasidium floriforme TaxID=5210 RepID=UPI001E8DF81F|nr:uncharacterized protein HD553DRAFT_78179 [Filobasidium floriforme]KAH8081943.1 hypothetical protein HD553DRAFT_78179 [Filobasidium floriforme]
MDERRCVLWTPQAAARDTPLQERGQALRREANSVGVGEIEKVVPSVEIDKSESVKVEEQGLDGRPIASTGCTRQAAKFICIKPEWSLAEVEKAYSHLVLEGEAPEEIMLDVKGTHFRQFVKAAEVGLDFYEQASAKGIAVTLGETIDQAGCGEWLTERDVGRVLTWVAKRALEMDVETGWDVPRGYKGVVLNLDQLNLKERTVQGYNGPSAPEVGLGDLSMTTGIGSTIDQPISLSDSDEDDLAAHQATPSKRPCSNEANGSESLTKKQRVTKAPLHRNRVVPDLTPTPSSTPTPTPAAEPNVSGRREGSPPPRRTRWTAAQQLAMVSKIYQAGYEAADYGTIAQRVNEANPTGPAKTRQRVKSAMRETHWTNFVNNNDGDLVNQLNLNMPDMTGPPVSKTSWTGPQKVIVWAETFGCGEKRVSWDDVAEAVNTAARGDESLYRKSKDCEKTWRDTMRRHFGLQGRRR